MGRKKLTNRNGVKFLATERMYPMAARALRTLEQNDITGIVLDKINFTRFACGEVKPKIDDNVRHEDVFLFFDFNGHPNDDIVNLMLTIDAIHLAEARRISLVLPYMPYMRQDRKDEPRTPISAAWFIRTLINWRSVARVITIDMHSDQLQSVFTIPTDHLPGRMLFTPWAKQQFAGKFDKLVAVAPDFGSAKRVRKLASDIDQQVQVAILEKSRSPDGVKMHSIIGASVKGKICLVNDDMMDTCGTIIQATQSLFAHGARKVILSATHAVFSPSGDTTAYQKLEDSGAQVIVSDSLQTKEYKWLEVLPIGELIGLTILQNITSGGSVSKLIRQGLPC